MSNKLEFISLFSGAGGLDIGFELAGWNCLYASDIDKNSIETLRQNRGTVYGQKVMLEETIIEQSDVREVNGRDILEKIQRKKGQVPLLVGGPPCQSWSSAGHQLGFDDPRGQLFKDYVRIAAETGVRWIIFENVRGLLTARGADGKPGSALEHIRTILLDAGFQTEVELLNAADFGVPQRRVRLVLIGYKVGDKPPFPSSTHAKISTESGLTKWVSLGQCLSSIPPPLADEIIRPNDSLKAQLSLIAPGSGMKSPGKRETTRPGGHWGYKQGAFIADTGNAARTVTASAQQDWIQDESLGLRRLSPRECAAIQSFPPNWKFAGKRVDEYRQVGNAVPPLLAYHIAVGLRAHIHATTVQEEVTGKTHSKLNPLKERLISAVHYTIKEERRNGESRRDVAPRRVSRLTLVGEN
ncbi:DNA cytosine methyltransferase [Massilia sp. RP-1-19]|uniref:DNA (cytosine-5-)-methyltransferase n=1 Tax=Massilia polaris TaxID=2728846 RepID=A0A848HKE2_9BURK|nr:DNA cytosine methyltransferase [Massilia polaris]NML60660.1 DNA cytosine methyltransferase [Massilia polaris]